MTEGHARHEVLVGARSFAAARTNGIATRREEAGKRNGQWPRREWVSGFDLAAEADLLIHDAQYPDEEYASHVGWGHSSYRHAFEFASFVGARKFIAFHHDPDRDDEMLDRLQENAVRDIRPNFAVAGGFEGAAFDIKAGDGSMMSPPCAST